MNSKEVRGCPQRKIALALTSYRQHTASPAADFRPYGLDVTHTHDGQLATISQTCSSPTYRLKTILGH